MSVTFDRVPSRQPGPPRRTPDETAHLIAARMARQITDVLTGRRPAQQLRARLATPVSSVLSALARRAEFAQCRLRSAHACLTSARTIEVCALLETHDRVRSAALKVERANTVWRCTVFALV